MGERVGRRIREARDGRGLTQEVLADKVGISRGYLARIETGRHEPSLTMLAKLAKALGVKPGALLD
jgi:transcriptional regulator with XRE-family HTH domain